MKKITLLAIICFSLPISCQGMAQFAAWLGLSKTQSLNATEDPCAICKEPLISQPPAPRTILACDHIFHHKCIAAWAQQNSSCPYCRKNINTSLYFNKKQDPSANKEPDPSHYFISLPHFLTRVMGRSPQSLYTFVSAVPLYLYLKENEWSTRSAVTTIGFSGLLSLFSLIFWMDEKDKSIDVQMCGPIKFNTRNYALTNLSVLANVCIFKGIEKSSLNCAETILSVAAATTAQHDLVTHLLERKNQ